MELNKSIDLQTINQDWDWWYDIPDFYLKKKKNTQPALAKFLLTTQNCRSIIIYQPPLPDNSLRCFHSSSTSDLYFYLFMTLSKTRNRQYIFCCVMLTSSGIVLQEDKLLSDANDLAIRATDVQQAILP